MEQKVTVPDLPQRGSTERPCCASQPPESHEDPAAEPPLACTLSADGLAERRALIAELSRAALLAVRRTPLILELTYRRSAAGRVRELAAQERQCCAFLGFAVSEDPTGVRLTITAPERAREAAAFLFTQFAATAEPGSADAASDGKEPT